MAKAISYPLDETKNYERRFIYDGNEILAQLDGDNKTLAIYTHSNLRTDDVLAVDVTSDGAGFIAKSSGSMFYIKDGLGSITDISDSSGSTVQSYVYSAFGTIKDIRDGDSNSMFSDPIINPHFTYTNREFDRESGMYYYRARFYDPDIGRFISVDPHPGILMSPSSVVNKYIYAGNNPVMNIDPDGKFFFLALLGGVSLATDTNFFELWGTVAAVTAAVVVTAGAGILTSAAIGAAKGAFAKILVGAISGALFGGLAGGLSSGFMSLAGGGSFQEGFAQGVKGGMIGGAVAGAIMGAFSAFSSSLSQVSKVYDHVAASPAAICAGAIAGVVIVAGIYYMAWKSRIEKNSKVQEKTLKRLEQQKKDGRSITPGTESRQMNGKPWPKKSYNQNQCSGAAVG